MLGSSYRVEKIVPDLLESIVKPPDLATETSMENVNEHEAIYIHNPRNWGFHFWMSRTQGLPPQANRLLA